MHTGRIPRPLILEQGMSQPVGLRESSRNARQGREREYVDLIHYSGTTPLTP
jgi:hypothetical protein